MLDHVSQVLVALANGAIAGIGAVMSLRTLLVLAMVGGLLWLAAVEVEDLDRRAEKPDVRRH